MAISDFIPEIWSARFLSNLNKRLVWGSAFGFDHEGEVRDGDTLKIPTFSKVITVRDYTENTDISDPEVVDGATVDVALDKQKYFNIYVDDVDAVQSRPDLMDKAMERSSYAMALQMDTDYRAEINVPAGNVVDLDDAFTADAFTKNLLERFAIVKGKMTDAGIPEEMRWAIISSHTQLALDSHFITRAGTSVFVPATQESTLRNGFVGNLLGFELRLTGQPLTVGTGTDTKTRVVLGQGTENQVGAVQIDKMEAYRPEKRFGDAVKGLQVYGAEIISPDRTWGITHKQSASL